MNVAGKTFIKISPLRISCLKVHFFRFYPRKMLFSYIILFVYFHFVTIARTNPGIIAGNLNSLLFVNQAFLNCPLKRAKLIIKHDFYGSNISARLPCKNNLYQMKKLYDNFLESVANYKPTVLSGWERKDRCKPLLSITDAFFGIVNLTTCNCFVKLGNDAISRSSFGMVKTCELLMQKWHLCHHIHNELSIIRTKQLRLKRSESELLFKLEIKHIQLHFSNLNPYI